MKIILSQPLSLFLLSSVMVASAKMDSMSDFAKQISLLKNE